MNLTPPTVSVADKMFRITTKSAKGASNQVRLRAGQLWLHLSGEFLTDNRHYSWVGTIDQARKCRRSFDAAAGCKMVEA